MKVTNAGVTVKCERESGVIVCEDDYADVAYLRLTEGVLNMAIILAVDSSGEPLEGNFA